MSGLIRWAHQGGAKEQPSNTLRGMQQAIADAAADAAADPSINPANVALECDVNLTADGKLAVIHDDTLERTTNGRGRVLHQPYDGTRSIDGLHAAWWWRPGVVDDHEHGPYPLRSSRPPDVGVPTIDDVLALPRPGMLMIEIKAKPAAHELARLLHKRTAAQNQGIVVTSFKSGWLRAFRKSMGTRVGEVELAAGLVALVWFKIRVGFGLPPKEIDYARLPIPDRILKLKWATPRLVDAAHRVLVKGGNGQKVAVDVWTIDDEPTIRGLLDLGVDGIMTDRPRFLRDVVKVHAPDRLL